MKANIIKYIFIIFVIFIIGFAIYKIYNPKNSVDNNEQINIVENKEQILTNMRIGISDFDNINPIISQNRDIIRRLSIRTYTSKRVF